MGGGCRFGTVDKEHCFKALVIMDEDEHGTDLQVRGEVRGTRGEGGAVYAVVGCWTMTSMALTCRWGGIPKGAGRECEPHAMRSWMDDVNAGVFTLSSSLSAPPTHFPCATRTCCQSTRPCSAGSGWTVSRQACSHFSPHLPAPTLPMCHQDLLSKYPAVQRWMDDVKAACGPAYEDAHKILRYAAAAGRPKL